MLYVTRAHVNPGSEESADCTDYEAADRGISAVLSSGNLGGNLGSEICGRNPRLTALRRVCARQYVLLASRLALCPPVVVQFEMAETVPLPVLSSDGVLENNGLS